MQVIFNVKLPAKVKRERRYFVSTCPILDVWSQGETKEKALQNLAEALKLFFFSCFERGTLNQVLKDSGFKHIERRAVKPRPFPKAYESIDIPLPFQIPPKADPAEWHA
jgi:predicted RNase H-like HicB family nuclease